MKNTLTIAAACLGVYVLLIITSTLVHLSEAETAKELLKPVMRAVLFGMCIWGLLKLQKWAWWLSVVSSALYGAAGLFGLVLLHWAGELMALDKVYFMYLLALVTSLLGAAYFLLLPSTRAQVFGRSGIGA